MKLTIVSGGQTGADRGAMDAAIRLGLDYGGWAPAGLVAEDDVIPAIYAAHMRETSSPNYNMRTRLNVQDSDATLIVSFAAELTGGSAFTARTARQVQKPCKHLVLPQGKGVVPDALRATLLGWLRTHAVTTLNVAGPRESKEPGIQAAVRDVLVWLLEDVAIEQLGDMTEVLSLLASAVDSDQPRAIHAAPPTLPPPPSEPSHPNCEQALLDGCDGDRAGLEAALGDRYVVIGTWGNDEGYGHHAYNTIYQTIHGQLIHAECGGCSCGGSGSWSLVSSVDEAMRLIPEYDRKRGQFAASSPPAADGPVVAGDPTTADGTPSPSAATVAFLESIESARVPLDAYEVHRLRDEFYALPSNGVGGSLHVVLDDHNWERESVTFCLRYAIEADDIAGEQFARLLLTLTDEQLRNYLGPKYCARCHQDIVADPTAGCQCPEGPLT